MCIRDREYGVHHSSLSDWLGGRNTTTPGVIAAGEAAVRWFEANEDKPTPPPKEGPPYDAEAAEKVKKLMERLGVSQVQAARECGVDQNALSKWLGGRYTTAPATIAAGEAAVRWFEASEDKTTPPPKEAPHSYDAEAAEKVKKLIERLGVRQKLSLIHI